MIDIYEKPDPFQFKTNPSDSIRRDKIIKALGNRRFKRALDIGCGEGFISQHLPADEIYGYDVSPLAMSRLPENVKALKRDEIQGDFDLVIVAGILYTQDECSDIQDVIRIVNKHASGVIVLCHRDKAENKDAVNKIQARETRTITFPYTNVDGNWTQLIRMFAVDTYIFHNIGTMKNLNYHTREQIANCKGRLTFDGVYLSVYENRDLLKDRHVILYFTGDYLGKDNSFDTTMPLERFCDMDQLKELEAMGCILGWHTNSHADLRKLADEDLEKEVTPPFPMDYFCYPYGEFNKQTIDAVKKAGFKFAHALWEKGNNTPLQLTRKMVYDDPKS